MGHVFKHTYTTAGHDGKRVTRKTRKWYIEYWDRRTGKRVRRAGYTDKKATLHLLAQLEREQDQIDAGYLPPGAGLAKVELAAHLALFLEHMLALGDTAAHTATVGARCRTILDGCQWGTWKEIDAVKLQTFLAKLRREGRVAKGRTREQKRPPISVRTSNHYQAQFAGFCEWLAQRMGVQSPLCGLTPLNAEVDRRHVRRVLTSEEFGRLLEAARAGPVLRGISGVDRAMLYIVAAYTGFRARELASLTPDSFRVSGGVVLVVVEAKISKHRREDTVPLPPAIDEEVVAWLGGKRGKLWPGDWAEKFCACRMVRADLKAAGIPYRNEAGHVFDFHALRHSYITHLVQSGVPLAQAQQLARHSSPALTAKHYLHLTSADLANEVKKLPPPHQGNSTSANSRE